MSSNLKVNTILPSTGTNVAIGTAGGSITMVGNVDIDINSGISTFNDIHISDKIVHDGDTNTSIRFPSSDTITFESGGSEKFRITSPASTFQNKLIIDDGSNGHLFLNNTSTDNTIHSGTTGFSAYKNLVINAAQHIFKVSNTERLRIDSSGNLNIGSNTSSNPFTYLRFGASLYGAADIRPTNETSHKVGLAFYTDGTQDTTINPTEKVRIDSSGRVLIGTTTEGNSSADDLTISGSGEVGMTIRSTNSSQCNIFFSDGTSGAAEYAGVMRYDHANNYMSIWTNGDSEKLRITSSGEVNIGGSYTQTTAPLCVTTSANDYGIRLQSNSNVVCEILNNDSAGNSEIRGYYNNNSGTRGEGYRLEANGTTFFNPGGTSGLSINSSGYVTQPNQPSFLVAPANNAETANGYVTYTTVFHNTGTHYSTSTGRFTAPVTGYYNFGANFTGAAANQNVFVRFYINGSLNQRGQHYSGGGNNLGTNVYMSCDLSGTHTLLQAGDYVQLNLTATTSQGQASYMRFYGYLVH